MRTLIRKKVFESLFNKTSFQNRVFRSRKVPLNDDEESNVKDGVILIYLEREQSQKINESPAIYRRSLDLSIAIIKTMLPEDSEFIEDQIEDVAQEVEDIFGDDDSLGGLASGMDFTGYEFMDDETGEYKQGAVKLSYSIKYEIERGQDGNDLDDFGTSHVMLKHNDHEDFGMVVTHQELPT